MDPCCYRSAQSSLPLPDMLLGPSVNSPPFLIPEVGIAVVHRLSAFFFVRKSQRCLHVVVVLCDG
jgi:hypothetical protein